MNFARSIAAPDLMTAMNLFTSSLTDPAAAPYSVSIDHSPSEQIDGSEWHNTAILISQQMEHHTVAEVLGQRINPEGGSLKQWKGTKQNGEYRTRFHHEFFHVLKDYPVLALVVSAKEQTILANEAYLANELGVTGSYKRIRDDSRTVVEFGPFIYDNDSHIQTLEVSEKHVPMALFTANYLLRMHTLLAQAIDRMPESQAPPLWMQIWSDKPPGNFNGRYAQLLQLLLGGGTAQGKFTWGGFTGRTDQQIDLLADNLAGMANELIQSPSLHTYKGRELQPPVTGVFHWERLE